MSSETPNTSRLITRRKALCAAGALLAAGATSLNALGSAETAENASNDRPLGPETGETAQKLKVATCQFPVSANPRENAASIEGFMRDAARQGAHLLHTSEASLSGYPEADMPSFDGYDWDTLRKETSRLRALAKELNLWLALGSSHYLDAETKPTNCIYLIDPSGAIVDRYDKSFCTTGDQAHYSAGSRLVTREIRGVKIGLAICYDVAWPQLYIAYRELGATVMIHSFYNAHGTGSNCLDVLDRRLAPTRCSDNRMWAVCNNSSRYLSHWGTFIARPDGTIPKELAVNVPGMLIHDFPDTLSANGWYHNFKPMGMRDDEIMTWGTPSNHPRQVDGRSEP
ncbi:MAG: carbon-nitrogen hydrolase family protein [Terracidiphilus sp.]|jgi:predicted amidohydrolase